eukprot:5357565-Prymnesium_polylepis.1
MMGPSDEEVEGWWASLGVAPPPELPAAPPAPAGRKASRSSLPAAPELSPQLTPHAGAVALLACCAAYAAPLEAGMLQ